MLSTETDQASKRMEPQRRRAAFIAPTLIYLNETIFSIHGSSFIPSSLLPPTATTTTYKQLCNKQQYWAIKIILLLEAEVLCYSMNEGYILVLYYESVNSRIYLHVPTTQSSIYKYKVCIFIFIILKILVHDKKNQKRGDFDLKKLINQAL